MCQGGRGNVTEHSGRQNYESTNESADVAAVAWKDSNGCKCAELWFHKVRRINLEHTCEDVRRKNTGINSNMAELEACTSVFSSLYTNRHFMLGGFGMLFRLLDRSRVGMCAC